MADPKAAVLDKQVAYSGEGISVKSLEESINTVRTSQNSKVGELKALRERNIELQKTLTDEVKKLRKLSDYVKGGQLKGGFWSNFKEILSYIPGLNRLAITKRSIEELLRQQYEISSLRVKEAAQFADKLKAAQDDLYEEIEKLNGRIVEAATNEETAAAYLLEVEKLREAVTKELEATEEGSKEFREMQAKMDKARKLMSLHSTQLQLYHTAEERMARLKENTHMLAETIGNLYSDITQYVTAASEKLDLVAGQIQAIGTAADASMVMLEMKKSLDVLTESMNQTTQFVSETQMYFRQNLNNLMNELELYDDQTRDVMQKNLEASRAIEEERIAAALAVATGRTKEGGAPQPEASA